MAHCRKMASINQHSWTVYLSPLLFAAEFNPDRDLAVWVLADSSAQPIVHSQLLMHETLSFPYPSVLQCFHPIKKHTLKIKPEILCQKNLFVLYLDSFLKRKFSFWSEVTSLYKYIYFESEAMVFPLQGMDSFFFFLRGQSRPCFPSSFDFAM